MCISSTVPQTGAFASIGLSLWKFLPPSLRSSILSLPLYLILSLTFFLGLKCTERASVWLMPWEALYKRPYTIQCLIKRLLWLQTKMAFCQLFRGRRIHCDSVVLSVEHVTAVVTRGRSTRARAVHVEMDRSIAFPRHAQYYGATRRSSRKTSAAQFAWVSAPHWLFFDQNQSIITSQTTLELL